MSNERSPRDVCSITIGINGLMSGWLLAAGGPQFRLGGWFFLVGRPDRVPGGRLLGRDALDLGGYPVERAGEPDRLTLRLVGIRGARLLDHLLGFVEAVSERLVDVFVGHLDSELVRDGLEHELAGNRGRRLLAKSRDEVLGRVAGDL